MIDNDGEWLTEDQLLAKLAEDGLRITSRELRRWEKAGLLPKPKIVHFYKEIDLPHWYDKYKTEGRADCYWGFWVFPDKKTRDKFIKETNPVSYITFPSGDGDIQVLPEPGDDE